LQSFEDEFELPEAEPLTMPAEPGKMLCAGEERDLIDAPAQSKYHLEVGKLLHLMK
jgi:hypothetical protein